MGVRRCISSKGLTAHFMQVARSSPFPVYMLNSQHPRVGPGPRLVERLGQEAIDLVEAWPHLRRRRAGRPSDIEHVALRATLCK